MSPLVQQAPNPGSLARSAMILPPANGVYHSTLRLPCHATSHSQHLCTCLEIWTQCLLGATDPERGWPGAICGAIERPLGRIVNFIHARYVFMHSVLHFGEHCSSPPISTTLFHPVPLVFYGQSCLPCWATVHYDSDCNGKELQEK